VPRTSCDRIFIPLAAERLGALIWLVLSAQRILAVLLSCAPFAHGQATDGVVADLQSRTQGHKYVLKSFSAQETTLYHLSGDQIEPDATPEVKAVALFAPTETSLSGTVLTIRGQRFALMLDAATLQPVSSPLGVAASLRIDFGGHDIAALLSTLETQLYFPSGHAAFEGIPLYLRASVPERLAVKGKPPVPGSRWIHQGTWQELNLAYHALQLPAILKASDPQMTRAASAARVDVETRLTYIVDENGHASEIWLTHPVGFGLDESSVSAIEHQLFSPGRYHGKPVAVVQNQVFHFQMR
jgi:hypothetical protein